MSVYLAGNECLLVTNYGGDTRAAMPLTVALQIALEQIDREMGQYLIHTGRIEVFNTVLWTSLQL